MMNARFVRPDFTKSIVNISATLAEFLGCHNKIPVLPDLAQELKKGYKNVVFLILDGLGTHPAKINLPEKSFLRRNTRAVLTSVFPSTTTNATTTLLTNETPMEHGWFGWCLYFRELDKVVDIFPEVDSFTGEPIEKGYVKAHLPAPPFYKKNTSDYAVQLIVPDFWHGDDGPNRQNFKTMEELFACIDDACRRHGKQFIYAYISEPDSTMHRFGVTSAEAHTVIQALNDGIKALASTLKDTLFVITADHGQTDVGETVEIYRDEELLPLLAWPPSLEARATAFKVKEGCREAFCTLFRQKYGADFELVETETLLRENYFGGNIAAHAEYLGDFIAIGTTDKIMKLRPRGHDFLGHHTSLTREEMLVPLILIGKK